MLYAIIGQDTENSLVFVFADEPTGNLDSRTGNEIMEIFQRLNLERDLTIVLVTHEPHIARYADRYIRFRDGRIRGDSPVESRSTAKEILQKLPKEEAGDGEYDLDGFQL